MIISKSKVVYLLKLTTKPTFKLYDTVAILEYDHPCLPDLSEVMNLCKSQQRGC